MRRASRLGSGLALYKAESYEEGRSWIEKAAEAGHVGAMVGLGQLFTSRMPLDYAKGLSWFEKAVQRGDAEGMTGLGTLYLAGRGVPKMMPRPEPGLIGLPIWGSPTQ